MADVLHRGELRKFTAWLSKRGDKPSTTDRVRLPHDENDPLRWLFWRILLSPKLTCTLQEIETYWTWDHIMEAHDRLDDIETIEAAEYERAKGKSRGRS